jgi:hypothetical protein
MVEKILNGFSVPEIASTVLLSSQSSPPAVSKLKLN